MSNVLVAGQGLVAYSWQDPDVKTRNRSGEGNPSVHNGTSQYPDGSNRALIPRRECKTKRLIPSMRSGGSGQVVSKSKTCASHHSNRCQPVAGRHDCFTSPTRDILSDITAPFHA